MQGAPEERAATRTGAYASKRSEEQRRRWDFLDNRNDPAEPGRFYFASLSGVCLASWAVVGPM